MELGCFVALLVVFAIVTFVVAIRAKQHAEKLEDELLQLRADLRSLERTITKLRAGRAEEAAPPSEVAALSAEATPAEPAAPIEPQPVPEVITVPTPPPPVEAEPIAEAAAFEAKPIEEPAIPPPPHEPPPTAPPPSPEPPPPPARPFDWESVVGVKLFSWIAGVALVLAAVFFLRYSVEHGWLSPLVRATLGMLTGVALIVVCELRVARDYTFTANALDGAGIAILYATLFAIYAQWHLLPASLVFFLMLIVTAVAVVLSIRRDSIFIALLGLLGGFATPALLSTGENRPIGLFTYILLLNIGLAWVAYQKKWPVLAALTVIFTAFYQWSWIGKFLTATQLPLAAAIFVVFALLAMIALWIGRTDDEKAKRAFDRAALFGAALPLLFAIYTSAVPRYGARYNVLFGFLLLIAISLAVIAATRGPSWLHALGGVTTLLVFAIWIAASFKPTMSSAALAWVCPFVALYLGAGIHLRTPAVYTAPLLLFMLPAILASSPAGESPLTFFSVAFLLISACAAFAIVFEKGLVYYIAAFFIVAAEAVWSARDLTRDRLMTALVLYALFGLFFLGVPAIARRFQRSLAPANATSIIVLLSIAMLLFLAVGHLANASLWGLGLLLAILNIGVFLESRATTHPLLAWAAILLSWIVIAVWWVSATIALALVPALAVVGGFGVLAIAGSLWGTKTPGAEAEFGSGVYLGAIGHLFLMFVASRRELALPPWPMFAVLLLLDLASGVAALYLRKTRLLTTVMAASQIVLMIWAGSAVLVPWPNVALIACIAVSAFAFAWYKLDRGFASSAAVALLLGQVVATIAGAASSAPLFGSLLLAHLILLAWLLLLAWEMEWHHLATIAAATTAFGTALARTSTPERQIGFAAAIYALFIAYPLLLGSRAKKSLQPYLAAILASIPFFFSSRDAITDAGYRSVIGILPLFQAALMLALLFRLLRIEAPWERLMSRLALVAAAALAFITVAVPLQLEKQWITIGWALEGAALVWLFTRIPHRGLLLWASALLGTVFVRLIFNPAVLSYHPHSNVPIINWYLYTYVVCAAAMFVATRFLGSDRKWARVAASSAGAVLLFAVLNIEIADFYSFGATLTFNFFSSSLAQDLTYTIGWALFAVAMLIAGIALHTRAARVAAIVLLLITILKCFLHDLARLGGLYRVGSLLGLALSLVIVGVLLQRFVMIRAPAAPKEPAP